VVAVVRAAYIDIQEQRRHLGSYQAFRTIISLMRTTAVET